VNVAADAREASSRIRGQLRDWVLLNNQQLSRRRYGKQERLLAATMNAYRKFGGEPKSSLGRTLFAFNLIRLLRRR
jgi:hypothetical protein